MKKMALALAVLLVTAARGWALESPTEATKLTGTAVIGQNYLVGYEWKQDQAGTLYGPYANLDFKQKLYEDWTAELQGRLFKGASSDDQAQLGLEIAQVSYVGPWFTVAGGRRDLTNFLSPGSYFGAYPTMGERQLDSAIVTFPFRLSAEIPDADAMVNAPFNALSVLYVPNLFEADQSQYTGNQGLVLFQLRVKFRIGESSSDLMLNYSRGISDYFQYSSVNGSGGFDASYAFKYGILGWWLDFAVQSMDYPSATSVLAAGTTINTKRYVWGIVDTVTFEAQIPVGAADPSDPFTGGDPQNTTLATSPQWSWFVQVRNKFGAQRPTDPLRFFYGGALTTSPGDYTLARLVDGTISQPVGTGFGVGPRIEGLPLRTSDYSNYAGIIYAGYEF